MAYEALSDEPSYRQQEVLEERRRMSFTLPTGSSNKDFPKPEDGNHVARLWRIIDLGTQHTVVKGKPATKRKLIYSWELLGTHISDEDQRPFTVHNRYTASLNLKSNLAKDIGSWRGRDLTEDEAATFDIAKMLNAPCLLNISSDDKYTNVLGVSPLIKGTIAPAMVNKPYFFNLEEFDQDIFDSLSDGIKNTIMQSPEYQAIKAPRKSVKPAGGVEDLDDSIPF